MAQVATQRTTGSSRVKGPMVITLRGAGSVGREGKYGGVSPTGTGLDVGLSVQVPSGQTANSFQVEKPDGTVVAGLDASGALLLSGNTASKEYTALVTISSANITGTSAGQLGHANGVVLVAAPGAGLVAQLISCVMSFTFGVAQYTAGGNITCNIGAGGAALTGLISAANSLASASSNIIQFVPLSTAGVALTSNAGINLVSSVAFTQPGTATGTVKCFVSYRIHTL